MIDKLYQLQNKHSIKQHSIRIEHYDDGVSCLKQTRERRCSLDVEI